MRSTSLPMRIAARSVLPPVWILALLPPPFLPPTLLLSRTPPDVFIRVAAWPPCAGLGCWLWCKQKAHKVDTEEEVFDILLNYGRQTLDRFSSVVDSTSRRVGVFFVETKG